MNSSAVLKIATQALLLMAELAAPMVLTALAIGFAVSLIQSITQIQEVTLSFVPKAIGVSIALLVCGNWMIEQLVTFTQYLFQQIPTLLGG
ncbi:flagellar biosynthetic protein FliQ [Leifsonia sp. L25]|uniref:flagellar biosynthetic protein FliQ n=1 Tax=Actinomycetes TaxID=1760 RepID=UPI003D68122E